MAGSRVFLTDHLHLLRPPGSPPALDNDLEARIVEHLREAGASFFPAIHAAVGGGFPQEVIDGLWSLVWRGLVTNDALHALRAYVEAPDRIPAPAVSRLPVTPHHSAFGSRTLVTRRGTVAGAAVGDRVVDRNGAPAPGPARCPHA